MVSGVLITLYSSGIIKDITGGRVRIQFDNEEDPYVVDIEKFEKAQKEGSLNFLCK